MAKPDAPPNDPTRAKLLDAAGQVFAEQGFHATTVREICARAGANVAAVNYYFGDKGELYEEVLRQAICAAHDHGMREALSTVSPQHALRRAIRYLGGKLWNTNRPSWTVRIMVHEMAQPTPALARVIDEIIGPNYNMFLRIVGQLIDLPPHHEKTRLCVHSIVGQVLHYAHARPVISHLWPDLQISDPTMDHISDHIADFSLAYLKSYRKTHGKISTGSKTE